MSVVDMTVDVERKLDLGQCPGERPFEKDYRKSACVRRSGFEKPARG
jgi:hypothetical protein